MTDPITSSKTPDVTFPLHVTGKNKTSCEVGLFDVSDGSLTSAANSGHRLPPQRFSKGHDTAGYVPHHLLEVAILRPYMVQISLRGHRECQH